MTDRARIMVEDAVPLLDDPEDLELSELNHLDKPSGRQFPARDLTASQTLSPLLITSVLLLSLIGDVVQTESAAYYEGVLGWNKPFASLYITHSSFALPWLCHLAYLRYQNRDRPYSVWLRDYQTQLSESIGSVEAFATDDPSIKGRLQSLASAMVIVTIVMTVTGVSWFGALSLTTPTNINAIYNSAIFFAAAFSVPLLRQKLSKTTMAAVAFSITGTVIVAYGDSHASSKNPTDNAPIGRFRLLGNLLALVGAIAFGLYEVLFKKWASSSRPESPQSSLTLTFAAAGLTGMYTFLVFWIGLVLLHIFNIETFVLPSLKTASYVILSVVAGSISMNSLLVLVIWTNPVFCSIASVLGLFTLALADWLLFRLLPSTSTYLGGLLILVAFGLMAKDEFGSHRH